MPKTKIKLLIVEMDYHASLLDFLCPLLKERFDLTLLCTRKIWDKTSLRESNFDAVCIKEKKESISQFMRRAQPLVQSADVLYFNTLEKHVVYFSHYDFPVPVIWRIHNANATFRPWQSLNLTYANWAKVAWYAFVKAALTRVWQAKARLAKRADLIMMPTVGVMEYSLENGLISKEQKISPFCLPFSHLKEVNHEVPDPRERLVISVTGTVDVARKDYTHLFEAISLLKRRYSGAIELHFLGAVRGEHGKEVVARFQSLEDANFSFFFGSGFVPQSEVDAVMSKTHFLVAPIKLDSNFKMHKEIYGSTKMSGVEIDLINYQKIAFVPEEYHVADNMRKVLRKYKGANDLYEQMLQIAQRGVKMDAEFKGLKEYDRTFILDRFEQILDGLITARRNQTAPQKAVKIK